MANAISIYEANGVTVENNVIHNVANGVMLIDFGDGYTIDPASDVVSNNSFSGVSGNFLSNDFAGALDASGNWYGTTHASTINGAMNGAVDFTPFLDSGTDTDVPHDRLPGRLQHAPRDRPRRPDGSTGRIQEAADLLSGSPDRRSWPALAPTPRTTH